MADLSQYLGDGWNPADQERPSYEPLPPGVYVAVVTKSEVAESKNKPGVVGLKYDLEVTGHDGSKNNVFGWITIANPASQKSVTFGKAQLAELCEACNIRALADSTQLIGQSMKVDLKIRKSDNPQYSDSNEVKTFLPITHQSPVQGQQQPTGDPFQKI